MPSCNIRGTNTTYNIYIYIYEEECIYDHDSRTMHATDLLSSHRKIYIHIIQKNIYIVR